MPFCQQFSEIYDSTIYKHHRGSHLLRPLCFFGRAQEQTGATPTGSQEKLLRIAKEVRKQIITLPQYGVFDNIHFGITPDRTVVLRGEASRPTLKSSAENVVKKIDEEPDLRQKFGAEYEEYCQHVRRWWPRLHAWNAS